MWTSNIYIKIILNSSDFLVLFVTNLSDIFHCIYHSSSVIIVSPLLVQSAHKILYGTSHSSKFIHQHSFVFHGRNIVLIAA